MLIACQTSDRRRAFTLVELIIVAALISLFSTLAIFGVQALFRSNQRKAIIGETRQIAAAIDFAYQDVGIFPKLCFLDDSTSTLELSGERAFGSGIGALQIYSFMQALNLSTFRQGPTIRENWKGPYFSPAQSRSRVSRGRGGSRKMILPDMQAGGASQEDATFDWPMDIHNNPYVVYMLNIDRRIPSRPILQFTTVDLPDESISGDGLPTGYGEYVNAVVSYGFNRVPGGGELYVSDGDQNNASDPGPFGLRLYVGNPDVSTDDAVRLLRTEEYNLRRANAWNTEFAGNVGITNALARSDDGSTSIGISDTGSDDVVFTF